MKSKKLINKITNFKNDILFYNILYSEIHYLIFQPHYYTILYKFNLILFFPLIQKLFHKNFHYFVINSFIFS